MSAPISPIPTQASLSAVLQQHVDTGNTAISQIGGLFPSQNTYAQTPKSVEQAFKTAASPGVAAVATYSRNVYAIIINGVAAQADAAGTGVGARLARINLNGPSGTPPPPAASAAGTPVAPGATNDQFTAATVASLRSLAGNGSIFGE